MALSQYSLRYKARHSGLFPASLIFLFIFSLVCVALAALGGASEFYDGWHGCVQRIATGQRHRMQRLARHHGDATRNAWLSDSAFFVQILHLCFFARDTLEHSRFYFALLGCIPKLQIIVSFPEYVHSQVISSQLLINQRRGKDRREQASPTTYRLFEVLPPLGTTDNLPSSIRTESLKFYRDLYQPATAVSL